MTNRVQHLGWMGIRRRLAANGTLALAILLLSLVVTTQSAQAQTFTVLYSFTGMPDGFQPHAGLVGDAAGNLYGTTSYGGDSASGTVFKLDATGQETVLHSFAEADGIVPYAGLIRDAAGNLYGTTTYGGASNSGTVFKLNAAGNYKVLYAFAGEAAGNSPYAGLIRDPAGNLYGTTTYGGAHNYGTVFKLNYCGKYKVLHSFAGRADGRYSYAGLVQDPAGNLYGTTSAGGDYGHGTVFKLDATGKETVLHSFAGGADGDYPVADLIRDAAGNLYGTTLAGGDDTNCLAGCGTVFKLDATGKETVLHSFGGGADGAEPLAGLVRDPAGNLYGTTYAGGGDYGWGTVFKLDATGQETVLHSFAEADGILPWAGLIRDPAGNLYGTTIIGGASGHGTVFKLTP